MLLLNGPTLDTVPLAIGKVRSVTLILSAVILLDAILLAFKVPALILSALKSFIFAFVIWAFPILESLFVHHRSLQ